MPKPSQMSDQGEDQDVGPDVLAEQWKRSELQHGSATPCAISMPVARAMIFSWVASAMSSVPLERPSHMTITRSLMPSTSSSSEEIMMIEYPLSASWFMSL